jgi:hypothetical protein
LIGLVETISDNQIIGQMRAERSTITALLSLPSRVEQAWFNSSASLFAKSTMNCAAFGQIECPKVLI